MTFGLNDRGRMTGAGLYTRVLQIAALLPAAYMLLVSGYMALIARTGPFTVLCDLGLSAMPRAWMLGVSSLYRLTSSELVADAAILIPVFILGLVLPRLLRGRTALGSRRVLAVLIGLDLALRLLPLDFNRAFGLAAALAGFAVRLGCLALLLLDLRAARSA